MTLDVLQLSRIDGLSVSSLNRLHLSFSARSPQTLATPIRRDADAANDRIDFVTVGQCTRQSLQNSSAVTVGTDQSIGIRIKGPRARAAHRLSPAEQYVTVPLVVRGPPDDRRVDSPLLESLNPKCDRKQRGSTRSIHGQKRPLQTECFRNQSRNGMTSQIGAAVAVPLGVLAPHSLNDVADRLLQNVAAESFDCLDVAKVLGDFLNVGCVGKFAAQGAATGVSDIHSRISLRQVERIHSRVPARVCRHFAHH